MSAQEFVFYFDAPVDTQTKFAYSQHQQFEIREIENSFMFKSSDLDADHWFKMELKFTQHQDAFNHFGS